MGAIPETLPKENPQKIVKNSKKYPKKERKRRLTPIYEALIHQKIILTFNI